MLTVAQLLTKRKIELLFLRHSKMGHAPNHLLVISSFPLGVYCQICGKPNRTAQKCWYEYDYAQIDTLCMNKDLSWYADTLLLI